MKKTFNILLLPLCMTALITSCLDDLDTVPLTEEQLLTEDAWKNPDSYEQFLSKIYAGMALSGNAGSFGEPDITASDQGEATFLRSYWNMQQLCTDETIGAEDNETMRGLQFLQWNSANKFIALNYTRIYLNIAYANEYLRETTEAKLDARNAEAELKEKVAGMRYEARVLRAMSYYFLMDLYANVPFIDEYFPMGSADVEQKDRLFLFPWIETELKALEGHLPPADRNAHYGMVNDPTVWMLLAKLYMNAEVYTGQNRYDDCMTYLNKVLTAGFSIDPVYQNVFCADNHRSPEIIFPIVFDGRRAATFGGTTFLIAAASKSDMSPLTTVGFAQAWSNIRAKESLSSLFAANDRRALFWKQDRTQATTIWYDFTCGWSVIKYSNLNSDGTVGSSTAHADTDFPFFRLADAYLMYAEAVLRGGAGGTRSQALAHVNELRDRAGIDRIEEIDLTLDFILDERSRELYWEGHRRMDLIRFNKFTKNYKWPWKNGVHIGVTNINDKYAIYPIPSTEVNANTNIRQNNDY